MQIEKNIHNQLFNLESLFESMDLPASDERLLEWLGLLALENKEWSLAESVFSLLLEQRDKALDLVGLAKSLRMQERFREAEECYLESLDKIKTPCSVLFTIYKALGEIYLLQNDLSQAEEFYNKAGTIQPNCKSLVFSRAMIALKEKNYKQAESYFIKYLKSYLSSEKAWLGIAISRKALGDTELAWACLKKCFDLTPKNSQALKLEKKWMEELSFLNVQSLSFSA